MIAAKRSIEIRTVAFSDHHAVIIHTEVMKNTPKRQGTLEDECVFTKKLAHL
jgi:hypothetical protein